MTIGGVSYAGRVTTGSLILAERDIGKPIAVVFEDTKNVGISEMAAIVRYALHPLGYPDRILSEEEWQQILNGEDTIGFIKACESIMTHLGESLTRKSGNSKN